MSPGEIYDIKRNNFIEKTKKYFNFLVSNLDFERPSHRFHEQDNGTITRDEFQYEGRNSTIVILNAYHPVDYGFEINLTDKLTGKTEMIHYVLKERQDIEQSYLKKVAELLKAELRK